MSMRPPRRFLPLWQRSGARQRLRLILLPQPATLGEPIPGIDLPRKDAGRPRVTVSGTKWILDGRPVELGAAVRTPYAGTQTKGRRNFSREASETLLRKINSTTTHP